MQLRALLLEYQRQQALYELSIRLGALAERQHGVITVDQLKQLWVNSDVTNYSELGDDADTGERIQKRLAIDRTRGSDRLRRAPGSTWMSGSRS